MIEEGDIVRIITELVSRFEVTEAKDGDAVEAWAETEEISSDALIFMADHSSRLIAEIILNNVNDVEELAEALRSTSLTTFAIGFEVGRQTRKSS